MTVERPDHYIWSKVQYKLYRQGRVKQRSRQAQINRVLIEHRSAKGNQTQSKKAYRVVKGQAGSRNL